jgi:hypothetical protein
VVYVLEAKNQGGSEVAPSSLEASKEEARSMLEAGSTVEEIAAATGLGRNQILGIKGSMAKANKKALEKTEAEPSGLGKADDEEKSLIADFKGENTLAASAVVLARNKSRLRQQDPALYNSLFPSGQQPESNTSRLADLEIARYIKSMRLEEEAGHSNNGDSNALGFQKQIDDLRAQLHQKDVEALKKETEKLAGEIGELRADLRHSTNSASDLSVVVREASGLLEKIVTSDGPLRQYLMPNGSIPIKPVADAPPLLQGQPVETRLFETLKAHGLTTHIIERRPS